MAESTLDGPCFNGQIRFNGSDYVGDRDDVRLTGQILRVYDCMSDGQWRTLSQIEVRTGDPQASISAQLRHLRKPRFGAYEVKKRNRSAGTFEYMLVT